VAVLAAFLVGEAASQAAAGELDQLGDIERPHAHTAELLGGGESAAVRAEGDLVGEEPAGGIEDVELLPGRRVPYFDLTRPSLPEVATLPPSEETARPNRSPWLPGQEQSWWPVAASQACSMPLKPAV
jgi:hypothetical protein